jgi:hypothetical protein
MTAAVRVLETEDKKTERWIPREWLPVYAQVVIMDISGISNTDIAKDVGFTKEHISNILNTPQAALMRREVYEKLQEKALETIPRRLEAAAVKASERILTLLNDDTRFEDSPFAVVDRGMQVLKGLNHLAGEAKSSINVDKAVILTGKHSTELLKGLEKANMAQEVHAKIEIPVNVVSD